jgi:hypothetical protein
MTDSREIVEAYLAAFYAGGSRARELLTDDFHFYGPLAHFDSADAFLKASGHAPASTTSWKSKRCSPTATRSPLSTCCTSITVSGKSTSPGCLRVPRRWTPAAAWSEVWEWAPGFRHRIGARGSRKGYRV